MDNQMNTPDKQYPEFFKVFLPEKSSERMLIPDAFVKRLRGRKLPEKAILRGHSGRVWHIYVRNIQGRIYFDNGWKKFVKANSLEAANFLVFKYDGGNVFMVKIYDKSRCVKKMIKEEDEEEEKHEDDDCLMLEIGEEEEEEEAKEEEEEEEEDDDNDEDFDDRNVEEVDDEDEDFEEIHVKETKKEKEGSGKMKTPHRCKRPRILPYKAEDYGIDVKMYVQPKNPYFVTTLKRSTRKNDLHIPRIIDDYNLCLPEKITLQGPIYNTIGKVKTWQDRRVCINGWRSFCYLNKITRNDICICEFMLETKTVKVHVVPGPV